MAEKASDVDLTDAEIEALVAAVSEEIGQVSDDVGDIDFDLNVDSVSDEVTTEVVTLSEVSKLAEKCTSLPAGAPTAISLMAQDSTGKVDENEKQVESGSWSDEARKEAKSGSSEIANTSIGYKPGAASLTAADIKLSDNSKPLLFTEKLDGSFTVKDSRTLTAPDIVMKVGNAMEVLSANGVNDANGTVEQTSSDASVNNLLKEKDGKRLEQTSSDASVNNLLKDKDGKRLATQGEKKPGKEAVQRNVKRSEKPTGGGGWGWGTIGSWSSALVASATTFTSHVGESFYHVLESVESTLVEPEDGLAAVGEEQLHETGNSAAKSGKESSDDRRTDKIETSERKVEDKDSQRSAAMSRTVDGINIERNGQTDANSEGADVSMAGQHSSSEEVHDLVEVAAAAEQDASPSSSMSSSRKLLSESGATKKEKSQEMSENTGWLLGWDLGGGLTHLTGAVKNTGKKVVSTGWGVIGELGKKTYNALMEDDDVSASDGHSKSPKRLENFQNQPHFLTSQDDAGVAHLEALEELSRWSTDSLNKQLASLRGNCGVVLREDLTLIEESFNLGDLESIMDVEGKENDFPRLLTDFVSQLGFTVNVDKLLSVQQNTRQWLNDHPVHATETQTLLPIEVCQLASQKIVEFTSVAVALYHKVGQLLLIEHSIPLLSYKFRALSLAGLTKVLCIEVSIQSCSFSRLLNSIKLNNDGTSGASAATSVELEASNSCSCLRDACCYLLPIMQLAVIRIHPLLMEHSGIAHLESLQVLSGMSRKNVHDAIARLESGPRRAVEAELTAIEAAFDIGYLQHEDDEHGDEAFGRKVMDVAGQMPGGLDSAKRLVDAQQRVRKYLSDCQRDLATGHFPISANDIHQVSVRSLADMTSCSIDMYYHMAQSMLLDQPHDMELYARNAASLTSLTKIICIEVGYQSTQFTQCLSTAAGNVPDSITPLVTNVYLEASSSSSYVQDGLQLLLPVIQLACIKAHLSFCVELTHSAAASAAAVADSTAVDSCFE